MKKTWLLVIFVVLVAVLTTVISNRNSDKKGITTKQGAVPRTMETSQKQKVMVGKKTESGSLHFENLHVNPDLQ